MAMRTPASGCLRLVRTCSMRATARSVAAIRGSLTPPWYVRVFADVGCSHARARRPGPAHRDVPRHCFPPCRRRPGTNARGRVEPGALTGWADGGAGAAVGGVDEASVVTAAHIANRLGTARRNPVAAVEATRDKRLLRRCLAAATGSQPRFVALDGSADAA